MILGFSFGVGLLFFTFLKMLYLMVSQFCSVRQGHGPDFLYMKFAGDCVAMLV